MTQRVLIVGADNFIGRQLLATLERSDWATPRAAILSELTDQLRASDSVVSCTAGAARFIENSAQHLCAALKSITHAPRVVHVSSMTVYGAVDGVVDEQSPLRGDLGDYAAARISAENLLATYPHVVTLRPGCEYGPRCMHWSERIAEWLVARRIGDLGALGDGECNLLYVDDLVAAIIAALTVRNIEGHAFNLASSERLTWNDYFLRFAKTLGAVPVKRVSRRWLQIETKLYAPPLKILELGMGRSLAAKLHLPSPLPPSFLNTCGQQLRLNVAQAETLLGLQWTPIESGLRETASWYLQKGQAG